MPIIWFTSKIESVSPENVFISLRYTNNVSYIIKMFLLVVTL